MSADISTEILEFYSNYDEACRLERSIGPLELERIKEILQRYLPRPTLTILDVGGGPGVHAFWLAGLGHLVHLIDLTPRHIEQARMRMAQPDSSQLVKLQVGDARKLNYPSETADAIILHGPLYHLVERQDRITSLREAQRVLRPGGLLFAVAITKPASMLVGLTREWIWDKAYLQMVQEECNTGQHHRPDTWPNLFTNAFFHSANDLSEELIAAGLDVQKTIGIQGPGWIAPEFENNWHNPARREIILQLARLVENQPMLSPHMMAIAQKR